MTIATLAFVILLVTAHTASDVPDILARPLSMLRDGDEAAIGYALFGMLAVITALMTAASIRAHRQLETGVFCLASLLLLVVAVTPSFGGFHILCSLVLIGAVYSYFGLLLHGAGSVWRFVHWPAALLLWLGTGFHSYGLWQKCLIVYLVLLVNIHYHHVSRSAPAPLRKGTGRRPGLGSKRRVVYVVSPGSTWKRRAVVSSTIRHRTT
jgi:hypothetical protein